MESSFEAKRSAALQGVLQRVRSAVGVPGLSAAISSSGERAVASVGDADTARAWPVKTSSRYGIACITKLLLAIVVAKLCSEGKLQLDQSIDEWLGKFGGVANFQRGITIKHLLSHTGGYQGPLIFGKSHRSFNWATFSNDLSSSHQAFQPGAVFNYENTGHVIIGEFIRHATGQEISDLLNEYIFHPLNIVPGTPLEDYKKAERYISPHRIDNGAFRAVAPSIFGPFWKSSLADITLTLEDMLAIGEAVVGQKEGVDFSDVRAAMSARLVALPHCVSGRDREHAPAFFNSVCAEYGSGWFGYAGSALGQTCGLRFDLTTRTVCAVALNAWLPIARDALLDQLCGTRTHSDAGLPGGNVGFSPGELEGEYFGGGNIIRSVKISASDEGITCTFGPDGLPGPGLNFRFDGKRNLIPADDSTISGFGFFAEPGSGAPCVMIGVASLKRRSP